MYTYFMKKINKKIFVNIENVIYDVDVTYKRQKGIYLRYKDNKFYCTSPYFVSDDKLQQFFIKAIPNLMNKVGKNKKPSPFGENYTYILGEKVDRVVDEKELFNLAYEVLTRLTRKYEKIMGINHPYNIRIKKMKGRYGSNSSLTYSISYQLNLIHFSQEIISSVVVHELAHHFYKDHQKHFYNCVLKYCPNYYSINKKLKKGIFK